MKNCESCVKAEVCKYKECFTSANKKLEELQETEGIKDFTLPIHFFCVHYLAPPNQNK